MNEFQRVVMENALASEKIVQVEQLLAFFKQLNKAELYYKHEHMMDIKKRLAATKWGTNQIDAAMSLSVQLAAYESFHNRRRY